MNPDHQTIADVNSAKTELNTQKQRALMGGSEMDKCVRAVDWSKTPLGPMESWSAALRTMVGIMLVNRFPIMLWWGPEYICFYNDAYIPISRQKTFLGTRTARE